MLRMRLDMNMASSGTPTPRNNTILLHPLETLSLIREACTATLTRWVEEEASVTCTKEINTKQKITKHTGCFRIATIMSGKRNPDCFSAEEKKTVQLTCMHREIELTFHLMFINGWNAVLLSKKTPILVGFLYFGIWDKRERENKKWNCKMGGELHYIHRCCSDYVIRIKFRIFLNYVFEGLFYKFYRTRENAVIRWGKQWS